MIAAQARALSQLLLESRQLEEAQHDAKAITATQHALTEIASAAATLSKVGALASNYLDGDQRRQIMDEIKKLQAKVRDLHTAFSSQPKQQSQLLGSLGKELKGVHDTLDALWRGYAQATANPHLDLLNLVRTLPEVQLRSKSIEAQKSKLQITQHLAPSQAHQLATFHETIKTLDEQMGSLVDLSPTVRTFLYRFATGTPH